MSHGRYGGAARPAPRSRQLVDLATLCVVRARIARRGDGQAQNGSLSARELLCERLVDFASWGFERGASKRSGDGRQRRSDDGGEPHRAGRGSFIASPRRVGRAPAIARAELLGLQTRRALLCLRTRLGQRPVAAASEAARTSRFRRSGGCTASEGRGSRGVSNVRFSALFQVGRRFSSIARVGDSGYMVCWQVIGTSGEIGRRSGLKIRRSFGGPYRFNSGLVHVGRPNRTVKNRVFA